MKKSTIAIVCSCVVNFALVLVVLFSSNPFWMQNEKAFLMREYNCTGGGKGYVYSSISPEGLQIGSYDCVLTDFSSMRVDKEPAILVVHELISNGDKTKSYELTGCVSGLHYTGLILDD